MNLDRTIENLEFPSKTKLEEFWNKRYSANFHISVLGRLNKKEYEKIQKNVDNWYELQDEILHDLFNKKMSDWSIKTTFLRVKLLNEFYSTNIPDICIYNVAECISKANKYKKTNKDKEINLRQLILKPESNGDKKNAIDFITSILKDKVFGDYESSLSKDIYSFATKFCHFCNPKEYSIYDQYVEKLLKDYITEKNFSCECIQSSQNLKKTELSTLMKDYKNFIEFIDCFIAFCELPKTYKDKRAKVDNFLWLGGMMKYKKGSNYKEEREKRLKK